ncbi:cytochrome P450 [Sistotremastrum niveocremeum HHB9708]|uniref:Cytochrome P450 n=1 Tax=Sistotremastrum niveocremeum HHB9708 TaxID=1314777 RepID=A0A164Q1W7_9AGAM|nr:cytochrome P450 [Sistotremastrum niveocremeum HHB9708]
MSSWLENSPFLLVSVASCTVILVIFLIAVAKSQISSIRNVPAPKSPSWFIGHLGVLLRSEPGVPEREWFNELGHTWRLKGTLGSDVLMTADPKAIQFILQTSGYSFQRPALSRTMVGLITGPSILWAEQDTHKRHRKVMLPAFGMPEARVLSPVFRHAVLKMAKVWKQAIDISKDATVVNIPASLARATLDALGEAAFEYDFGSVENKENELANHYQNLFLKTRSQPKFKKVLFENLASAIVPLQVLKLVKYIPTSGIRYANRSLELSNSVASELVYQKENDIEKDKSGKDVMTLLVKSNNSEMDKTKLSAEEMLAQMSALMIAGHETTSNTITWTLWELSKAPKIQSKLRDEIRYFVNEASSRGLDQIPPEDYEKMTYTTAVLKETLRYHNVVPMVSREAAKDCVIPLSKPITATTGEVLTQIPVKKGIKVFPSISQYNRLTEIWGENADSFWPERWLTPTNPELRVGAYANLASFGAGIHACIGWRFAVVEMQTFLIELMDAFEFQLTEDAKHIRRERAAVTVPLVLGQESRGVQLPLKVSLAKE